jgi:hypothetical protein
VVADAVAGSRIFLDPDAVLLDGRLRQQRIAAVLEQK